MIKTSDNMNTQDLFTADAIRQEFEATVDERIKRYLQVKPHGVIPNTYFASASSECSLLFRDGHYYGCISLTQSVTEALVKFLCEKNGWKPEKDYDGNIEKLLKRRVIDNAQFDNFKHIWEHRNDFHHLNSNIAREKRKLEEIAKDKLHILNKTESSIFAYTFNNGVLVPTHPKYWEKTGSEVYLRLI